VEAVAAEALGRPALPGRALARARTPPVQGACVYQSIYIYVSIYIYIYMDVYMCVYICVCVCIYIYTCIYICVYGGQRSLVALSLVLALLRFKVQPQLG